MSNEKPVCLKRKASTLSVSSKLTCICHYDHCSELEVRPLSDDQFVALRRTVDIRQSQT